MGLMGISAIIARWRPDNLTIRKYAGIGTSLRLIKIWFCSSEQSKFMTT